MIKRDQRGNQNIRMTRRMIRKKMKGMRVRVLRVNRMESQ